MQYLAYQEYIPTQNQWINRIPSHWRLVRLKFACCINPTKSEVRYLPEDMQVSFLPMELIGEDGTLELAETRNIGSVFQGFTYFRNGDVIVAKITPCFENGKGALVYNLVNGLGFGTTELHVLRPLEEISPKFLYYITHSELFRETGSALMTGAAGQKRVPPDFVANFEIGLSPLPEQRAIADFLDRETTALDALIARKRELVARLQEKRNTLINSAVTDYTEWIPRRSINTEDEPWLFPLPPGWQRQRLKFNTIMKGRLGWQNLRAEEYTEEGPYLVSSEHFANGQIEWHRCNHVTRERYDLAPEIKLRSHDVLFMKDGAAMGKLAYVHQLPGDACVNSHLLIMRPANGVLIPRYLYYVLKSQMFQAYMIEMRTGTTFFGLSQKSMGDFPISFPSVVMQNKIVSYLDKATLEIDRLIEKIERAIERLQEYRTALISAAVTGKIDVRTAIQEEA